MENKKAIEPVIATVLLIVITIVAVALVVSFVVPFLQKQMQSAQVCYNAKLEIKAEESCYNATAQITKVKVARGSEEFDLVGVIIKASNPTTTKTKEFRGTDISELGTPFGEKILTIPGSEITGTTSVAVAPIVKAGTVEKICDITSQVAIQNCA